MAVSFIGGGNQRPVTCSASGAFTEPMQRPHYWPEDHFRVLVWSLGGTSDTQSPTLVLKKQLTL